MMQEQVLSAEDIAVHEAGHAVIMLLFGCPFATITIEKTTTYDGAVLPDQDADLQYRMTHNVFVSALLKLVNSCAGDCAVAIQRGEAISVLLRKSIHESRDDASNRYVATRLLRLDPETAAKLGMEICCALFQQPAVWAAAEQIRDIVLAQKTISYSDAKTIFDAQVNPGDLQHMAIYLNNVAKGLEKSVAGQFLGP